MDRFAALTGLLAGSAVVAVMILSGYPRWGLFQAGLYGFFVNSAICLLLPRIGLASSADKRRTEEIFQSFR